MPTEIAACDVWACHYNQQSLCTRTFITLNEVGKCDFGSTQEPLPDPPGPNNEPSFVGPVQD